MEDYSVRFTSKFSVSEYDLDTLKGFINFLMNRAKDGRNTPYGLLVQYETYDQYKDFLDIFEKILDDLHLAQTYRMVGVAEKTIVSKQGMLSRALSRNHIMALLHCEEEGEMDILSKELKSIPEVIKIVGASSGIIEHRFQSDPEFRYRTLPRIIRLSRMKIDAVTQEFLYQLKEKYKISENFEREIAYYIDTIYDEADYQEQEFIQDLILRIERQMEEREGIDEYLLGERKIDESFIPFSLKVKQRKEENDKAKTEQVEGSVSKASEISGIAPVNEAEVHVQNPQTADNPHTDIMILAMSTFPFSGKISKNTFTVDGQPELEIIGRSQLDPIPKYVASQLEKAGECLDQIIILATDPTREEKTVITPEGTEISISPVDYFKRQIRGYMNPDGSENPEEFDKKRFHVINANEENPAQGMQEIMKELRMVPSKQLRLHMAVNGGLRGVQRILEAMVMLLRIENIQVCGAYSTEMGKNKIIDETGRLKIFHFVAGMNEFHFDGRINALDNYLGKENPLTDAIQLVSDGIGWCNVQKFEQGLDKLKSFFEEKKHQGAILMQDDPYLRLFEESIQQDYGTLIGKSRSALEEIKWCQRKGFYQQALTFLESRMSEMLVEWGILTINTDQKDASENTTKNHSYRLMPEKKKNYYLVDSNGAKYTKKSNKGGKVEVRVDVNTLFNGLVFYISNTKQFKYQDFNSMTEHDLRNLISYANDKSRNYEVKKDEKFKDYTVTLDISGARPEVWKPFTVKKRDGLVRFLFMHKILKNVRNDMNHAKDFRYDQDKIKLALDYYIRWAEELKNQK